MCTNICEERCFSPSPPFSPPLYHGFTCIRSSLYQGLDLLYHGFNYTKVSTPSWLQLYQGLRCVMASTTSRPPMCHGFNYVSASALWLQLYQGLRSIIASTITKLPLYHAHHYVRPPLYQGRHSAKASILSIMASCLLWPPECTVELRYKKFA